MNDDSYLKMRITMDQKYEALSKALLYREFLIETNTSYAEKESFMNKTQATVYKGVAILSVVLCYTMGTFGEGTTQFTPLGGGIGVAYSFCFPLMARIYRSQ